MKTMMSKIGSMTAKLAAILLTFGCASVTWAAAQIGETPYSTLAEAVAAESDNSRCSWMVEAEEPDNSRFAVESSGGSPVD